MRHLIGLSVWKYLLSSPCVITQHREMASMFCRDCLPRTRAWPGCALDDVFPEVPEDDDAGLNEPVCSVLEEDSRQTERPRTWTSLGPQRCTRGRRRGPGGSWALNSAPGGEKWTWTSLGPQRCTGGRGMDLDEPGPSALHQGRRRGPGRSWALNSAPGEGISPGTRSRTDPLS